jgi:hypothetical protein
MEARDFYKIVVEDTEEGLYVVMWLDSNTRDMKCLYRKGSVQTNGDSKSPGIYRSLSKSAMTPGQDLKVILKVFLPEDVDYYAIEERLPDGWTVSDPGDGSSDHAGYWKYVIIEGAVDTQLTYTVTTPNEEGDYSFEGTYMFEGMDEEAAISGDSAVTVE